MQQSRPHVKELPKKNSMPSSSSKPPGQSAFNVEIEDNKVDYLQELAKTTEEGFIEELPQLDNDDMIDAGMMDPGSASLLFPLQPEIDNENSPSIRRGEGLGNTKIWQQTFYSSDPNEDVDPNRRWCLENTHHF